MTGTESARFNRHLCVHLPGAVLLLLFGFAAHTIVRSPCLGVADILDFWRVMRPAGIDHVSPLEHPGYYVRCEFATGEADLLSGPSSSAVLAWAAKHLRSDESSAIHRMDLRQMGVLFLILTGGILAWGLARGLPVWTAVLLVYVLIDPGYLLFFNSFYADGALLAALFGACIWLSCQTGSPPRLRTSSRRQWILATTGLVALALLGGGSKMQYVIFPAVLLLVVLGQLVVDPKRSAVRVSILGGYLALVFCAVAWNFFFGPGPRFVEFNNYHAVYGGILRVSSRPERVLRDLHIPAELWNLPRTDAWSAGVDLNHPIHRHLRDLSRSRLLASYLADPAASLAVLEKVASTLTLTESHPRGNRQREVKDRGPVKRVYSVPWQYSKMSRPALRLWPPLIWIVLGSAAGWLVYCHRTKSWSGNATAILMLLLWIPAQICVAVLGEGLVNLHQHLLGARLGFDLLLVLLLVECGTRAFARPRVRLSTAT